MSAQGDLFGAPAAAPTAPPASQRRAPVRSRAPVAPTAPTTAPAAPPSAPAAAPEPAELWEHFGLTREQWLATVERVGRTSRVVGAAHTAFMLAPDPPGVAEARLRAHTSRERAAVVSAPGGISSCEPDPVDPADLRTCSCGLVVHRGSLASHLAAAERGVPWSLHLARSAEGAC